MVLSKGRLLFWLLSILAIGFACGYLFSSKFCSVSIGKRVEKISTLNQTLRKLFALRTFYKFEYQQSEALKTNNSQIIQTHLMKINEEITMLIAAYYYNQQSNKQIIQGLQGQISPDEFAAFLAQLNPTWAFSVNDIKENLIFSDNNWQEMQKALSNNNWAHVYNLFEKNLALAMEFADELDKGITQQFPHKF